MPGRRDYSARHMCELWKVGWGINAATGIGLQDSGMSERRKGLLLRMRSEAQGIADGSQGRLSAVRQNDEQIGERTVLFIASSVQRQSGHS